MSNAGQGIAAVVGGIIGFFVGGPTGAMYGFQLGLLAGTALFPTQLPAVTGPRLEDLATTAAQVGTPVIRSWGTFAVPGTVMWLGPIDEVASTEEAGGKGAPEQEVTTYAYFQPIAIGLVGNQIGGILRIWENGTLVYDVREQQEGETAEEFAERTEASFRYSAQFEVHLGTPDQLPDPVIEMYEGVGNVPAFRDLAYVVFTYRRLRDDQGRRHPQWRFEIFDGTGQREYIPPTLLPESIMSSFQGDELLVDWARGRYIVMDMTGGEDEEGFRVFRISDNTEIRQQLFIDALAESPRPFPNLGMGRPAIGFLGHIYLPWFTTGDNVSIARIDPDTLVMDLFRGSGGVSDYWHEAVAIFVRNYGDVILSVSLIGVHFSLYDGTGLTGGSFWTPGTGYTQGKVCRGSYFSDLLGWFDGYAMAIDPDLSVSQPLLLRRISARANRFTLLLETEHELIGSIEASEVDPTWTRFTECQVFIFDDSDDTLLIGIRGADSSGGSTSERFFKWDPETTSILWNISTTLPAYGNSFNGSRVENHRVAWDIGLNTSRYFDTRDGSYTDTHWDEPSGTLNGEHVFDGSGNRLITFETGLGPVVLEFGDPSPEDVSLATIVRDVCNECGLNDTDIDVDDLTSRYVHGYARTRPMPGRSCIDPLRMVGFFDCVESGTVLKWPTRGKQPVATIEADELGSHETATEASPSIITRKADALELPRMMRVHYVAPSRDYEPGEQISPVRLTTEAVNDVDVDLVAALDDDQAAQIAEIIWADAWRARWMHEIVLDRYRSELEPADAVLAPVDSRLERMRIASIDTSDLILRRLSLVRDDDGSYESTAVAEPPQRQPSRLTLPASTALLILDIPALREIDDDAGLYAAAARAGLGTSWNGAVIYRSTDNGSTWSQIGTVANEAKVGRINTPLPVGITSTWDNENSIDVVVGPGTTLESRTEDDVLSGANAAAIGTHGRWEIVQFLNAEQIGTNRYRLSGLLRGRRGTEHLVGTSEINDRFVLVSGPGIVRLPLATAQIGVPMLYRAVSVGSTLGSAGAQSFTGTGMALETFSPVYVRGERDSTEDLTITWIRRDRLHQTMRSGVELPNSEDSESYSIDIMDGDLVARTLSSSIPSAVYAAEDQITDFGSTQPVITVRIYQLSAIVGRGTPAEATI